MSRINNDNLMLGDYVVYNDQIYTVFKNEKPNEVGLVNKMCGEVHVYLYNDYNQQYNIYPVKLTKELLEQNGFTLVDNCTSKWSFVDDYGNTIIKSVWFWIVWIIVSLMTLGPLFVVAMYPVMLIDDYFEYKWNKQNKG